MSKMTRSLAEAERIAAEILADVAPFTERVEVAGSIRRGKAEVGDIEIVATPRLAPAGLFGDRTVSALWEHLCTSESYSFIKGDRADGRYHQLQHRAYAGLQVDIFLAQPDNWGWILLVRTGSAVFSTGALTAWKRLQGIGPDAKGSIDGRLVDRAGRQIATPEEATVFELLGMEGVPPRRRTDDFWEAYRPLGRRLWLHPASAPDED